MGDVSAADFEWESEEVEHSRLGASSAHRWMNCPGSVILTAKLGPSKCRQVGQAARLGTAAHTLASMCFEHNREPYEYIGTRIDDFPVDMDMASAVTLYINHDYELLKEYNSFSSVQVHTEVPLQSAKDPDAFGTADRVIYVPGELIHINDYKHGIGVIVEPDCAQTKYYGALAYENRPDFMRGAGEPKQIKLTITQPRAAHPKGPIRNYETVPSLLEKWFDTEILPAMAETRKEDAALYAGDWCRFCPARDHCPALKRETLEFETTGLTPEYLTNDELGEIKRKIEAIKAYGAGIDKEVFSRAMLGNKIKHYKLVHKQANRAWKEGAGEELVKTFGDAAYEPRKLRSPAQVEKEGGGKAFVTKWAYKPTTGYTIAPEGDKRGEVSLRVDYFGDLPDDLVATVETKEG